MSKLLAYLEGILFILVFGLGNLVKWIWDKLKPEIPQLSKIELFETCTSGCVYEGI